MRRVLIPVLALVAWFLVAVSTAPPVSADQTCNGGYVVKETPWRRVVEVPPGYIGGPFAPFALSANLRYHHCPDIDGPHLVRITVPRFCATKLDGHDPRTLQGFKYNYFISLLDNRDKVLNPPERELSWDGRGDVGGWKCRQDPIQEQYQEWWFNRLRPAYQVSGEIALEGAPNRDFRFDAGGDYWRQISVENDETINPFD